MCNLQVEPLLPLGQDVSCNSIQLIFSECQTAEDKLENNLQVQDAILKFLNSPASFGCLLPCQRIQFEIGVHYFDEFESSHIPGGLKMYTIYDSMVVETQKEIWTYSWASFLSAMGGALGLYFGFSCLFSVFFVEEFVRIRSAS